jgi:hypothetical protein
VHLSFIGQSDTYLDTCDTIRFRDDTFKDGTIGCDSIQCSNDPVRLDEI